jgi:hypothetical protein
VFLPLRQERGTNSTEWKKRTVAKLKLGSRAKSRAAGTCRVTVSGFEATVTSTGQHDIRPPGAGLPPFCFAGVLRPECWEQFPMFAIRSGRLCLAEFEWIEDALTKPKWAKLGRVQPIRHAKTAIQRDIPAATATLNP